MDESEELIVDAVLVERLESLRKEEQYERTPNVEMVVYFSRFVEGKIIRGTAQSIGGWLYEYVPGVGY
jgi:hypothetical protein